MEKRPNIKLTLDQGVAVARDVQPNQRSEALADIIGVEYAYLLHRSIDARRKTDVHFVVTAGIGCSGDELEAPVPIEEQPIPDRAYDGVRPIVVGMGPAGMFAALELAEAGLRPILVERGANVDERSDDVERYHRTRVLDSRSNVQFGEGGAGTFSDGKLTTGKNSPLNSKVLRTFVSAGAPSEILWLAKPHIGTDVLSGVIKRMRERIIQCDGDVLFKTQLVDMRIDASGSVEGVTLASDEGEQTLRAAHVVLACGHSARDTFALLKRLGFELSPKPFSIGVRIEQDQAFINVAQYGKAAGHPGLGAADYKLSCHLENGRSVYTFCMCPGGQVVAAASEEGGLCVNGMSYQARDGRNANAALLCNVVPEDFENPGDPLSGIEYQRKWERKAFELGGGDWDAPAQRVKDFAYVQGASEMNPRATYPFGVTEAPLASCLPGFAAESLRKALPVLDRRLHGFADPRALMTGIEARSSSPVQIARDPDTLMATRVRGAYPCGEGAGYAGGIMSAAVDGMKVAQAIIDAIEAG